MTPAAHDRRKKTIKFRVRQHRIVAETKLLNSPCRSHMTIIYKEHQYSYVPNPSIVHSQRKSCQSGIMDVLFCKRPPFREDSNRS